MMSTTSAINNAVFQGHAKSFRKSGPAPVAVRSWNATCAGPEPAALHVVPPMGTVPQVCPASQNVSPMFPAKPATEWRNEPYTHQVFADITMSLEYQMQCEQEQAAASFASPRHVSMFKCHPVHGNMVADDRVEFVQFSPELLNELRGICVRTDLHPKDGRPGQKRLFAGQLNFLKDFDLTCGEKGACGEIMVLSLAVRCGVTITKIEMHGTTAHFWCLNAAQTEKMIGCNRGLIIGDVAGFWFAKDEVATQAICDHPSKPEHCVLPGRTHCSCHKLQAFPEGVPQYPMTVEVSVKKGKTGKQSTARQTSRPCSH